MLLKKQFNIPDKRFWHVQVRTLAKAKAWEELAKLVAAKGKAPPIGYLVRTCRGPSASARANSMLCWW